LQKKTAVTKYYSENKRGLKGRAGWRKTGKEERRGTKKGTPVIAREGYLALPVFLSSKFLPVKRKRGE